MYPDDVNIITTTKTKNGAPEIVWRIETPVGVIERARAWEQRTYAWGISQWGVSSEQDMKVLQYAMSRRQFVAHWDRYQRWDECVGDDGVVYMILGYSAMGYLMHYWMGVESVVYAAADWPVLKKVESRSCATW